MTGPAHRGNAPQYVACHAYVYIVRQGAMVKTLKSGYKRKK
jgi:hypothetical protein